MHKIGIVTDSTADIPDELTHQQQIHVVPNLVVIDGRSLKDGVDIARSEFYTRLPEMKTPPTTATASAGDYEQLYASMFAAGFTHIISIHASSLLSGIFNAASLAAQAFGERVQVIDSQSISMGLGFQVLAAAEAALRQPLESVLQATESVRCRVRVIAMLDTLEYVRRSGRVSWARARLGDLMRIKPFVEVVKGQVQSLGETRTRQKGIHRLLEMIRALGSLEKLAVLHTNAEADARLILEHVSSDIPIQPFIVNVTTVIGAHVGPNGLGLAAVIADG